MKTKDRTLIFLNFHGIYETPKADAHRLIPPISSQRTPSRRFRQLPMIGLDRKTARRLPGLSGFQPKQHKTLREGLKPDLYQQQYPFDLPGTPRANFQKTWLTGYAGFP
jgi:hypothetical protein